MRERFHPFNTARIVRQSFQNSTFLVDHKSQLAERLRLQPRAALLYPGPEATLISEVPLEQRPHQLVVVDGTWHQAKTLVRDIGALRDLPRYRLAPSEPSRYRLRREPNAISLSTVEAVVQALRVLEPQTRGLEELLAAFNGIIERQLAHPKAEDARRRRAQQDQWLKNVPKALMGSLHNIVVAYGESNPNERGIRPGRQIPLFWVAERLVSGERFVCAIRPEATLDATLYEHLELTPDVFAGAPTLGEARAAWESFLGPDDILAVYSPSTVRLLKHMSPHEVDSCLVLKSVDFHPERRYGTLEQLVQDERLEVASVRHPGRAGRRLALAKALIHHLHSRVLRLDRVQ